jgi:hypothetical protein
VDGAGPGSRASKAADAGEGRHEGADSFVASAECFLFNVWIVPGGAFKRLESPAAAAAGSVFRSACIEKDLKTEI